jgi:hypothetical protein
LNHKASDCSREEQSAEARCQACLRKRIRRRNAKIFLTRMEVFRQDAFATCTLSRGDDETIVKMQLVGTPRLYCPPDDFDVWQRAAKDLLLAPSGNVPEL